ncbi:SpoIIE family protein phosphatase [Kitasatospora sp. NPDC048540]|uniref:SpoIIE family protein phosphatase n=1 Tax=Kitasatospora sp. NPDC048540 TaxID=3155634 RepID=UPI0033ED24F2
MAAATEAGLELLSAVLDGTPAGIAVADARLHWLHANPAFERATGVRAEELSGRPVAASALAAAGPAAARALADERGGETVSDPLPPTALRQPGLRLSCRRIDLGGRPAGVVATLLGAGAETGTGAATREPDAATVRLAVARAADEEIGTTLDADTTCVELAEFAIRHGLADIAAVDLLPGGHGASGAGGRIRLHRAALTADTRRGAVTAPLAQPGENVRHRPGSPTAEALATGRAVTLVLLPVAPAQAGAAGAPRGADPAAFRAAGAERLMVVPLLARGRTLGVLHLARLPGPGRPTEPVPGLGLDGGPDGGPPAVLGDLAGHAALAIDNAQRYTRSQHVALDLQRALLAEPANPHPNLQLATRYRPSGSHTVVGGDWYETVRLPFGRTLLVIGDVMGHGVEAAVDMSTYRSMLRYTAGMDLPPHRILRQLDTLISENESARPATCLLALADPARHRWTFANAGHLPPALISPDRPTELVQLPTGPPLGTGLSDYEQARRPLTADQTLLLYTDGLVERRGEDIDTSLARLAALPLPATGDLEELLDTVLHSLAAHPAEDDTALLAARPRTR